MLLLTLLAFGFDSIEYVVMNKYMASLVLLRCEINETWYSLFSFVGLGL